MEQGQRRSQGMKFGLTKIILEHYERRPGLDVLLERSNRFMEEFERKQQERRAELEAQAAEAQEEEGWTTVLPRLSREQQGTASEQDAGTHGVPGESGDDVDAAPAATAATAELTVRSQAGASGRKKKSRGLGRVSEDFYKFQARDTRRMELLEVRQKFEEDKKRIAKLREARKFKPY